MDPRLRPRAVCSRPRFRPRTSLPVCLASDSRARTAPPGKAPGRGRTAVSGWSKAKGLLDDAVAKLRHGRPLPAWRFHDLRRTTATGLKRLGVSLQVIEAILGHVSGSRAGIVGVYQRHHFDDEKRAALDAWARHVEAIVGGRQSETVTPLRGRR